MSSSSNSVAILLAETDLAKPEQQHFMSGEVVLYTHRAPNKSGINEDCLALIPYNDDSGVLLIADGVGGHPQGHTASQIAVQSLYRQIQKAAVHAQPLRDAILDGIEIANQTLLAQGRGAATTLAVIELQHDWVRPYHVGDSLILVLGQRGRRKLQSIAHSPVGYAVEAGMLDADEAIHHKERHLVSNILGSDELHIQIGINKQLAKHDTLLLASDGLADNLYEDEITEIIRKGPLAIAAERLVQLAKVRMCNPDGSSPSHPDDLSFILFRLQH